MRVRRLVVELLDGVVVEEVEDVVLGLAHGVLHKVLVDVERRVARGGRRVDVGRHGAHLVAELDTHAGHELEVRDVALEHDVAPVAVLGSGFAREVPALRHAVGRVRVELEVAVEAGHDLARVAGGDGAGELAEENGVQPGLVALHLRKVAAVRVEGHAHVVAARAVDRADRARADAEVAGGGGGVGGGGAGLRGERALAVDLLEPPVDGVDVDVAQLHELGLATGRDDADGVVRRDAAAGVEVGDLAALGRGVSRVLLVVVTEDVLDGGHAGRGDDAAEVVADEGARVERLGVDAGDDAVGESLEGGLDALGGAGTEAVHVGAGDSEDVGHGDGVDDAAELDGAVLGGADDRVRGEHLLALVADHEEVARLELAVREGRGEGDDGLGRSVDVGLGREALVDVDRLGGPLLPERVGEGQGEGAREGAALGVEVDVLLLVALQERRDAIDLDDGGRGVHGERVVADRAGAQGAVTAGVRGVARARPVLVGVPQVVLRNDVHERTELVGERRGRVHGDGIRRGSCHAGDLQVLPRAAAEADGVAHGEEGVRVGARGDGGGARRGGVHGERGELGGRGRRELRDGLASPVTGAVVGAALALAARAGVPVEALAGPGLAVAETAVRALHVVVTLVVLRVEVARPGLPRPLGRLDVLEVLEHVHLGGDPGEAVVVKRERRLRDHAVDDEGLVTDADLGGGE